MGDMRVAACFLAAAVLFSVAQAQEFKGVLYQTPKGWQEDVEGDAKIFAPKDLKSGEILAVIMTGAVPTNGADWQKQFSDTIALANDGAKVTAESKIEKRETSGLTVFVQSMALDHKEIGKHSRLYSQVSQGDQRVFVTVIINKDELLEKHSEAVMELISSLKFKAKGTPDKGASTAGKIPTGNTPDLISGTPGWLPSGKGVPIPAAAIVNGKPVGLWWKWYYDAGTSRTKSVIHIYLPDGTRASNPRLGGGLLFDLAGQKAQRGATGVGTFSITNGQIVEMYDGFENKAEFVAGKDSSGVFFKIGGGSFRPLTLATTQEIVGQWKGAGVEYRFKSDGTYETGMAQGNGDFAVVGHAVGRYVVDGYLIQLVPSDGASYITIIAKSGTGLVIGSESFTKR